MSLPSSNFLSWQHTGTFLQNKTLLMSLCILKTQSQIFWTNKMNEGRHLITVMDTWRHHPRKHLIPKVLRSTHVGLLTFPRSMVATGIYPHWQILTYVILKDIVVKKNQICRWSLSRPEKSISTVSEADPLLLHGESNYGFSKHNLRRTTIKREQSGIS